MESPEAVEHVVFSFVSCFVDKNYGFHELENPPNPPISCAALGDPGECRMWELVANLVFWCSGPCRRGSLRTRTSSAAVFISLLAFSTMGTSLEDEYPTSFRDFSSFHIFSTPSLTSLILPKAQRP